MFLAVVFGATIGAVVSPAAGTAEDRRSVDRRSIVLFEKSCVSDRGRQIVTLFANGTIRLKESFARGLDAAPASDAESPGTTVLHLAELTPEETRSYRRELIRAMPSDGKLPESERAVIEGVGVETCTLIIDTGTGTPLEHAFAPLEVPSLRLERWLGLAGDLIRRARPSEEPETLDEAYEPDIGDVLRDRAGQRFRIRWITFEGIVELDGIDTPVHLRVAADQLAEQFVAHVVTE